MKLLANSKIRLLQVSLMVIAVLSFSSCATQNNSTARYRAMKATEKRIKKHKKLKEKWAKHGGNAICPSYKGYY
ncbi:hypothetical protein V6R21_06845 [Limibacter armeniacum]|uniref:hypothetical protein n=1 Tax=Limibacter armeniacum TaxID=466084 RepID=UPI002FE5426E